LVVERDWGDLEGTPHREIEDLDVIPNIETGEQIIARADKALRYLEGLKAEHILVVSHGTFGRALRHHILEDMPFVNEVSSEKLRLPNGEIIQWI
jgi:broad specificity phosphatase PhoE